MTLNTLPSDIERGSVAQSRERSQPEAHSMLLWSYVDADQSHASVTALLLGAFVGTLSHSPWKEPMLPDQSLHSKDKQLSTVAMVSGPYCLCSRTKTS